MSNKLFDGSDESDNDLQLGTNKDYAKSYNNFRKKELLKKFKDRGHDVSESDSSSSESSEDEVLDPKFDQEFFKTLASLKSKDPTIYNKETRFFEGGVGPKVEDSSDEEVDGVQDENAPKRKQKSAKPVTLKDYERKIILERGGKYEDDSDAEEEQHQSNPFRQRAESPTLVEEERRLKDEFKQVMQADDDAESEDEEFGGIFKKRQKSKEQTQKEDEDFAQWLAGKQQDIEAESKQKLEPLKNYWDSNKLPQSERFLRDYILNKGYAETAFADIPTYDEIVGDTAPLSEDEEELEKQAEFEHKYNFRFEEPDAEFIQRYPRTIEQSVRRTDDKRKQKRQELKQRKHDEKEQKMREYEIIKDMKRKEIEDKISKLKMVTGNDELGFKDEELEEDFDPDAHDRRMQEIFNDDYYQVDEGEEKPECPSDIDELRIEDWDNYDPQAAGGDFEPHCEDDDFNMDCDYDETSAATSKEQLQQELIENTRARKGGRKGRRNRFMEMIQTEKPAFDPQDEKTYEEYIDEYYKLDCEDIIGDVPCRFKYVETTPNDFGLTIEEILLAKNKELNQWASLKKSIQIRPDYVEKKEQRLYKLKAKNEDLKRKIFKSLYGEGSDDDEESAENTKSVKAPQTAQSSYENAEETAAPTDKKSKKKRKRQAQAAATAAVAASAGHKSADQQATTNEIASVETPAKKPKLEEANDETKPTQTDGNTTAVINKKKKNRKKKNPANQEQTQVQDTTTKASVKNAPKTTQNNTPKKAAVLAKETNVKSNPFNSNKFKSEHVAEVGALPPLRKQGKMAGGGKFTPKFNKFAAHKSRSDSNKTGNSGGGDVGGISDERLKAYGINPKKFHNKQKFGKPN